MYARNRVRVHFDGDQADMRLLVLFHQDGQDLGEPIVAARFHESVPVADVAAHLSLVLAGNLEVVS